jgi:hypothetical protein
MKKLRYYKLVYTLFDISGNKQEKDINIWAENHTDACQLFWSEVLYPEKPISRIAISSIIELKPNLDLKQREEQYRGFPGYFSTVITRFLDKIIFRKGQVAIIDELVNAVDSLQNVLEDLEADNKYNRLKVIPENKKKRLAKTIAVLKVKIRIVSRLLGANLITSYMEDHIKNLKDINNI